ncbi:hypothetical protein LFL97_38150 (plasmid) [Burkholderia sp. JSH-S8]|nr:hypothetical protein LFL97_38150 [Burkholderia sp. JSH-S8]
MGNCISGSHSTSSPTISSSTPAIAGAKKSPSAAQLPSGINDPRHHFGHLKKIGGKPNGAASALGDSLKKALDTREPLSESNFLSEHVHEHDTPTGPGANGLFYHEIQRADSGTCAIHATNAYSGSGKYNLHHFANAQSNTLGLDYHEAKGHILKDGNEAYFVKAVLDESEGPSNTAEIAKFKTELADILDHANAGIDRVMVGLAGPGEPAGHWVAFRKDGDRKWHKIDSYPGGISAGNPQPNLSPADFLRQRPGTGSNYSIIYR